MYMDENLFATEYKPFAATFKNQDIIVRSETLIIHHDNWLGINGKEYFINLFASSFENSLIPKYFHIFNNTIIAIKAMDLPTTVETNKPHAPIRKNTNVITLETTVIEADTKLDIAYTPFFPIPLENCINVFKRIFIATSISKNILYCEPINP